MELSDKLIELRKESGYTQEQSAQLLGVSRQAVSKWESGNGVPDINNLIEIAKLYHVKVDDLITNDKKPQQAKCRLPNDLGKSIILVLLGFFMGISSVFLFYPNFAQTRNNEGNFEEYEKKQNFINYVSAPDFKDGYPIQLRQIELQDSQFISVNDCRLTVIDEETVRIRFSFVAEGDFLFTIFTPPSGDIFIVNDTVINQEDGFVSFDLSKKLFKQALNITMNCYPMDTIDRSEMNFYSLSLEDLNYIRNEIR